MSDCPPAAAPPIVIEVTRGELVESRHLTAAAVMDAHGGCVHAWGDVECLIYPRSAIKPLQALALVESGAAERYGLSAAELALACSSHGGEPAHVQSVQGWLARVGLGVGDLQCGSHPPLHEPSAQALLRNGETPSALHNNCSGKHAGFLTTARHLGEDIAGYLRADHPAQRRVLALLEAMAGEALGQAPRGIDGCGIPVYGMSLRALALAVARLADPAGLTPERREAVLRVREAMAGEPFMVAGSGRFGTDLARRTSGRVLVKTGAEGVMVAIVPRLGLGVAVKVQDGAARPRAVALGAILHRLGALSDAEHADLAEHVAPRLRNHAGTEVGTLRPAF